MMRSIVKGKEIISFAGIMLFLIMSIGCATGPGPYVPKSEAPSIEDLHQVVLLDKELKKWIAVDHVAANRLPDGRLKAKATLRNMKANRAHVQVQTVFKGADGFSLGEDSAWQDIILTAHETRTYTCDSMKLEATSFNIRIRQQR